MNSCDPTSILFAKIRSLEPEYASKIIGYLLLQDVQESDLMRLVLGPETILQSLIQKVRDRLGLPSNTLSAPSTPPSPSPLNPISRPPINGRAINPNGFTDSCRNNASSHSSNSWSLNRVNPSENGHVGPKSGPFLSFGSIRTNSLPNSSVSHQNSNGSVPDSGGETGTSVDLLDEQKLSDYLSFLDDSSSKAEEVVDFRVPLGYSGSNGDTHLHRRSFSASDACFGSDDGGFGVGFEPCMYFSKGFCKNGDSCRFIHGGFADNVDGNGLIVGSPSKMDDFYRQNEEMMRMKLAYQQRLATAQILARAPRPYEKRTDFYLHPQGHRVGAFPFGDERNWCSNPGRLERNEFLGMSFGDKSNSASRQIYLTFPADSTFKDEDVANYFSFFGAVQDVRIPYQQKRMFGFVSFVHPETVKLVLARGNPHFICDSRVLVKPYKEKGKFLDRKQQHLLQQIERGNFSPCSSPSGIDLGEPCDFNLGEKMFYDAQDSMRRKIEQADLERAIELERRKLMNLQLPEFKNKSTHNHHRRLSIGSPGYLSSFFNQNPITPAESINQAGSEANDDNTLIAPVAPHSEQYLQAEANPTSVKHGDCDNKESDAEEGSNIQLVLPDTLFVSTQPADNHQSDESEEVDKSIEISATNGDNPETPATSSGLVC